MGSDKYSILSDVADVIDSLHKTPKYSEVGYPMVRCVNISYGPLDLTETKRVTEEVFQEYSKKYTPQIGDIIITRVGANFGETTYVEDTNFCLGQNTAAIKPKAINADYLYFILNSADCKHQMDVLAAGAAQPTLSIKSIKSLKIPRLGEELEQNIAGIVGRLNKKITIIGNINQTLEKMTQTLFKSWFVDFDIVIDNALDAGFFEQDLEFSDELLRRAEARKAVRASADFKPLPEDVRQLFPAAFEECSEASLGLAGWVPGGWVVSTTGDEFTVKGGSTPSTANPEFWEGGDIHWTSPKDLSGSKEKIMLDTERKITCDGLNKITSGLLPSETVLMSSRAPIGYLALTKIPVAINQGYIAIPATKRLSQEYVLYWLTSSIDEIKGIAGGTTFAEISKKTFKSISIVIPNTEVVNIFSGTTKSYLNKMTLNAVERSALEQLRDTLLPKLISGELRLSDSDVDTADEVLA